MSAPLPGLARRPTRTCRRAIESVGTDPITQLPAGSRATNRSKTRLSASIEINRPVMNAVLSDRPA
jgi:hypothetical protein